MSILICVVGGIAVALLFYYLYILMKGDKQ